MADLTKSGAEVIDTMVPSDREPSDVCVIGSGPAGLVVAAGLTRRGLSVTLLESGDTHPITNASSRPPLR